MNETFHKHFLRCDVQEKDSLVKPGTKEYWVDPIWKGVDRPVTGGWVTDDRLIAQRLQRAVESGKVFSDVSVDKDTSGNTFVLFVRAIDWKYPNSALAELGF